MTESYDSTEDVKKHIWRVKKRIQYFALQINDRSIRHDKSKLEEPEKPMFDTFTPKLKELVFGSDEYKAALADMGPALQHHYQENRHHPEHFKNGINGMTLVDLVEMISDWMAMAEVKNSSVNLVYLSKRFNISKQLVDIITNTIRENEEGDNG
jgi:hypothetical protein